MKNIREMLESGMTKEQIIALVNGEAANYEKEKAAADNEALIHARGCLIDAIVNYANTLGIIDSDTSDEDIDELTEILESALIEHEKEAVSFIKRAKKMEKISNLTREKESAATRNITDDEILKIFIRSLR